MSRKSRITAEEKIQIAQDCIEGRISQSEAARRVEVDESSVRAWIARYEAEGSLGFAKAEKNRVYSEEMKRQAVIEYLAGNESLRKICKKYKIRDSRQLRSWIKVYNSGRDFKKMSGGSRMKNTRKTTQEERIQIAKECIENGNNYGEIAIKYQVSYQNVYTWVKKYRELGEAGLEDRRGQRTAQQEPRTEAEELRVRIAQLEHELYITQVERDLLKKGDREERGLSQVRQAHLYEAVKASGQPIDLCCELLHISRSAYYKWHSSNLSPRQKENEEIAEKLEQMHMDEPEKGYRRLRDDLEVYHGIPVNDKRVLRICRKRGIKSTIKYANNGCTRQAKSPQYIAENLLNRDFHAEKPNEKWLTDVTEFKWYEGIEVHKVYLSAILDLYDRRIVSYVIRDRNDNPLVFDTFDLAAAANPGATPLFHSDRGFQYTNRTFHQKLVDAGMTQSMSRVGKCIDNGPMEGFWGILKRERYYGRRFTDRESLVRMIENYIVYYNHQRLQRNLGVLTPMQKYELYKAA